MRNTKSSASRKYDTSKTTSISFRNPVSALTHYAALIAFAAASPFLLEKAFHTDGSYAFLSAILFSAGLICLYSASAIYHTVIGHERLILSLKRLDHIMIYILIAASYTPVCLLVLQNHNGKLLILIVWFIALIGLLLSLLWITSPKWLNSSIYIAMGWLCIFSMQHIISEMPPAGFRWLLTGGIFYTLGGILYAIKPSFLRILPDGFGFHEIFHCFVAAGSTCHFIMFYGFLL